MLRGIQIRSTDTPCQWGQNFGAKRPIGNIGPAQAMGNQEAAAEGFEPGPGPGPGPEPEPVAVAAVGSLRNWTRQLSEQK